MIILGLGIGTRLRIIARIAIALRVGIRVRARVIDIRVRGWPLLLLNSWLIYLRIILTRHIRRRSFTTAMVKSLTLGVTSREFCPQASHIARRVFLWDGEGGGL